MEAKKNHEEKCCSDTGKDCCGSGKCCSHPVMHCIIKTIIILIILGLIGMAGFSCGARLSKFKYGSYGMMNPVSFDNKTSTFGPGMMNNFGGYGFAKHMNFWGDDEKEGKDGRTQLFGLVTKVEGNKITVTDNGGKEQVVLSQSSTTILNSIGEVGLQSIKVGQGLSVAGKTNTDKQIEAVLIRIM